MRKLLVGIVSATIFWGTPISANELGLHVFNCHWADFIWEPLFIQETAEGAILKGFYDPPKSAERIDGGFAWYDESKPHKREYLLETENGWEWRIIDYGETTRFVCQDATDLVAPIAEIVDGLGHLAIFRLEAAVEELTKENQKLVQIINEDPDELKARISLMDGRIEEICEAFKSVPLEDILDKEKQLKLIAAKANCYTQ